MSKKLRVLLIRPKPPAETIGLQHVMICEPLELEYLAGNLDKDKVDVRIVDMILEKRDISYYIKRFKPHIVAMTGYITHVGVIKALAKKIKSILPKTVTVVGGVHAEVVPTDFVSRYIDYIICHNPLQTFVELVDYRRRKLDIGELTGIYKKGRIHVRTANIDFAVPDRQAVSRYRSRYYYMFHNPCALIKTSLGCPYTCSFCFCKEVTGGKYKARDIKDVMDEIESIKEREIYIVDDDFLFNEKRLDEFCDEIESRGLDKRFLVYGRADFIASHERIIKRLSKHGLRAVIVGIESVREKDLDNFNKRSSLKNNENAIKILKKYDVELYATMILQPDFTKEDFRRLEDYLINLDVCFVNLQPLTPLPGTEIYDDYKDKILVRREDYAFWDLAHIVLQPKHMSIREYYYQIIKSYTRIVLRPKNIVKMLRNYGFKEVFKMYIGSQFVSMQYIFKIIRGF